MKENSAKKNFWKIALKEFIFRSTRKLSVEGNYWNVHSKIDNLQIIKIDQQTDKNLSKMLKQQLWRAESVLKEDI